MNVTFLCGWMYAIAWGVSFYPTLYLNYRLKTADSISIDFLILNIIGYACYAVSLYLQLYSDEVRRQYQLYFNGKLPILSTADLFYSIHGLVLLNILLSQVVFGGVLWGFHNERINFKPHRINRLIITGLALFLVVSIFASDASFAFLNLALNLSYFKLIISLIKYIPQVLHNHRRKTMHGISKLQIILDLTGCLFAGTEFFLKNTLPFLEAVDSNRGKVGVVSLTFLFSLIFLFQIHIYGTEPEKSEKEKRGHELA